MGRVKSFELRRGKWINGYCVRERLGRGWEGEVYRVREKYSDGQRVLKLFDPALDRSRHMADYCRKLEALSEVPGIIRFYHAGYWDDRDCSYLVMQYVEGAALDALASTRPLPLFRALRIVRELLRVIRDAHARGFRVGDIHEGNVVLVGSDRPIIIDVDLGSELNRNTQVADLTAVCKLLYSLNWNKGPYSPDLRKALPKHADALRHRYRNAESVLRALGELMGA